jgi:maleylacetoacetate isomerase
MTKTVLYDYWRSSASYRVRLALALKGVPFTVVPVNLLQGDHCAPAHIMRNPQGLVPALMIDGQVLTQSLAILDYLEETRPTPALLPSDSLTRAQVRAMAHVIAMEIHPVCNLSVANHVTDLTCGDNAAKHNWMQHFITKGLAAFETLAARQPGPFCYGETPGLADCCLIPQLYNAHRWGVSLTDWPRIRQLEAAYEGVTLFKHMVPVQPA